MSVIYHPRFCQSNSTSETAATPHALSVVIYSQGNVQDLEICLSALRDQAWPANEIIILDATENDQRIAEICAQAEVIRLPCAGSGVDRARNIGLAAANSQIVAFLGEDCVPRVDWVCQILCAFDADDIDVVIGCARPGSLESFAQITYARYWSVRGGMNQRDYTQSDFLGSHHAVFPVWDINCGSNLAVRRSSFARYGLFDPGLDMKQPSDAGESEFIYRVLGQGGVCRYTPDAVVWRRYVDTEAALQPMLRDTIKGHIASLRIQAQRFPGRGNWRRILVSIPLSYAKRGLTRLRWGRDQQNWFLMSEVRGYFEGLFGALGPRRKRLN